MTEQPGVPSAADLDAVNAELAAEKATAPAKDAHDAVMTNLTAKPQMQQEQQSPDVPAIYSREGVLFDPEVHAAEPDGSPKTDSRGVFIEKIHDHTSLTPNIPGGK
jgi:hypothetical protein